MNQRLTPRAPRLPRRAFVLSCLLALLALPALLAAHAAEAASAKTITVTTGNDAGPGSLRQAVLDANDGGTILIDIPTADHAGANPVIGLNTAIVLNTDVVIKVAPPVARVTVESLGSDRAFVNYAVVEMSGLTLINGRALGNESLTAYGGSILNFNEMTIRDCDFRSNWANGGGGAIANLGRITVSDFSAEDSRAVNGGGGFAYNYAAGGTTAELTAIDGRITGSVALGGGGFFNGATDTATATLVAQYVNVEGGSANSGGAFYNESAGGGTANLVVRQAYLADNTAVTGGAAINNGAGSAALFENVTMAGNSATADALAVASANGAQTTLSFATLLGNVPGAGAGPDITAVHSFQGGAFTIQATIAVNERDECDPGITFGDDNLVNDGSCGSGAAVDEDLGEEDFELLVGGKAIGYADPLRLSPDFLVAEGESGCGSEVAADANDGPRPVGFFAGKFCTIGAHQSGQSLLTITKEAPGDDPQNPTYFGFELYEFPGETVQVSAQEPLPLLVPAAREVWLDELKAEGWVLESVSCTVGGAPVPVQVFELSGRYALTIFKLFAASDVACTVRNKEALDEPFSINLPVLLS